MGGGWFLPQARFVGQVFAHSQASTDPRNSDTEGHLCIKLFDHKAWISKHLENKVSSDAPGDVFCVVRELHPLCGMAFSLADNAAATKFVKTCSMAEAARFADAVAVFCCEAIGNSIQSVAEQRRVLHEAEANKVVLQNATAVGNLAFIGIHHSSETVRARVLQMWNRHRALSAALAL